MLECVWPSWSPPCRWESIWASGSRWSTFSASASLPCAWRSVSAWTRRRSGLSSTTRPQATAADVGCHSDAHEQAKWFGDDIALKSGKYDHELGSISGALAALRLVGSGNPPLHRFRVGLEFAWSGHRDLNGMIAQHSALAQRLAEQLGLSGAVQASVGAAYEQWDGKGWPGRLKGRDIPVASRLAQIGEFSEVAHRVGGVGAAVDLVKKRAGTQFDPDLAGAFCANSGPILEGLEAGRPWAA